MDKRNLLVVGASKGIGRSIVEQLADKYEIYSTSRGDCDLCRNHLSWDASETLFPDEWLPETLSGLVYCPGTINLMPFSRLKSDAARVDLEVNYLGAIKVLQAVLPALKRSGAASVVMFSSVAVSVGMPMHSSVAGAKGAVEGLTRSLAAELSPLIRVNAIAPSLTDTPLASRFLKNEKQREALAHRHPMQKLGDAAEIAALAAFLLSEQSSWMTGQVLAADGGMSRIRKFE